MAHLIAKTANGRDAMAFVGETPWHGLGQRLTLGATLEQWRTEAGLDWQAQTAPVEFVRSDGSRVTMGGKQVIYRSDTGAALSVMGDGYQIVQPGQCLEFFRELTESQGWHLNTAGVLKGGALFWAMASRDGNMREVVAGDRVKGNLLFATSLDGSTSTVVGFTTVRVVCANTLGQALRGRTSGARAGRGAARVSHRSIFDADAVKAQIGLADDAFSRMMGDFKALAAKGCTLEQAREILRGVFGQPVIAKRGAADEARAVIEAAKRGESVRADEVKTAGDTLAALLNAPHVVKDHNDGAQARDELARLLAKGDAREQRSVARCLELFAGAGRGASHPGVAGTSWGLLNAVTEHIDHEQGRAGDTRLTSAWFGRGADFKQDTLRALLEA